MNQATLLFSFCFFFACNSTKDIRGTEIDEIRFGSGGGFTGEVVMYSLSPDGDLNRIENDKQVFVKNIGAEQVRRIYLAAVRFKNVQHDEPGNIYSFIETNSHGKTHRILWSPGSTEPYNGLYDFYSDLIALTK